MDELLPELLQIIIGKLHTVHLLPLMTTCKSLYAVGKASPRWQAMRIKRNLPGPKANGRKLRTDFDIVQRYMKTACRLCFLKPGGTACLCKGCRKYSFEYLRLDMAISSCKSQQEHVDWLAESLAANQPVLMEAHARLQKAEDAFRGKCRRAMWMALHT